VVSALLVQTVALGANLGCSLISALRWQRLRVHSKAHVVVDRWIVEAWFQCLWLGRGRRQRLDESCRRCGRPPRLRVAVWPLEITIVRLREHCGGEGGGGRRLGGVIAVRHCGRASSTASSSFLVQTMGALIVRPHSQARFTTQERFRRANWWWAASSRRWALGWVQSSHSPANVVSTYLTT